MPRYQVQTQDGRTFEVEAADPQAAAKVLEMGLQQRQSEQGGASPVADVAASLGSGLMKGIAEVPMTPVTVSRFANDTQGMAAGLIDSITGGASPEVQRKRAEFQNTGPGAAISRPVNEAQDALRAWEDEHFYKPKTTAGEFAQTIGEFSPMAATPAMIARDGSRVLSDVARYGVVPGATSEAAGQATKGTDLEGPARFVGGLVGGGLAAVTARPSTAAQALRTRLPKGATATDIDRAEAMISDAQRQGITLTWPEALADTTNGRVDLTDLQRVLEQSRGGQPIMREKLSVRPAQMEDAMAARLRRIGPLQDPAVTGTRVQRYATDALDNIRQRINQATEHLITRAGRQQVDPLTFSRLKNDPLFAQALDAIATDPIHSRAIQGYPADSVQVMNEVKKYFDRMAERSSGAVQPDNYAAATYRGQANEARDAGRAASPEYGQFLDEQALLRRQMLEPRQAGPMGALSRTDNLGSQLDQLFSSAPIQGSEKAVGEVVRTIARQDPETAGALVRAHLKRGFDEANQRLIGGNNEWGAAKFSAQITGNDQQFRNLREAVLALPNGGARWAGFQRLLRVMEATGKRQRPGSMTAQNQTLNQELARGGGPGTVTSLASSPGALLTYVRDAYQEWKLGRNTEQMARIITDPEAGDLFRRLLSAKSDAARALVAGRLLAIGSEIEQGRFGNERRPVIPALPESRAVVAP